MTKPIPPVKNFMTAAPLSIQKDASLLEAAQLMQKEHIRHLPVVYQGKIEGILTSTDINLIRSLKNVDIEKMKVYDCFTPNPYTVHPDTHLDEVLSEMAEKKYGCVIISDHDQLVGIFTWVDALIAARDLLETRLRK
ncbi:MAG: CBS domain-containing protein [Bacteriovoracaceae bacterium]